MIKGIPDIPGPYELTCINFEFCDNKRHVLHFIHVVIGKLMDKIKKNICHGKIGFLIYCLTKFVEFQWFIFSFSLTI